MSSVPSATRRLALEALVRIERDGAYANLVLGPMLARSGLDARDRAFVTELVYGTTRMRRACDHLVDRFLHAPVADPPVRAALRLGAYQLSFAGLPPHAAVDGTVGVAPRRSRGLVNAVLRRVAGSQPGPEDWPDDATRLSYPDWVLERLVEDLGSSDALAALAAMNEPAGVRVRSDGYRQDLSSQLVVDLVGARAGERVLDVCAAPGGKATALAATGAFVVAADRHTARLGLVVTNREALRRADLAVVAADALRPPWRAGVADRVLVDAPCSGLGALGRRPDARWRIRPEAVDRLADQQVQMLVAATEALIPGGTLVFSVCTLTTAETTSVVRRALALEPRLELADDAPEPWERLGVGARLLPHQLGSDGMYAARLRRR